jgi:lysozyme
MNRAINKETLGLIKEFEGFRAKAYKDTVGVWTIGYGTTAAAGVGIDPRPGMEITEAEAEWYLQKAVAKFADRIEPKIKRGINDNQFGAFVSLAYNIGPGAFLKSSALRHFNAGDTDRAANAILLFNKAGGKVLKGLVRRREAERALFLRPAPLLLTPQEHPVEARPAPQQPTPAPTSPPTARENGRCEGRDRRACYGCRYRARRQVGRVHRLAHIALAVLRPQPEDWTMQFGPLARILLRYGIGYLAGSEVGDMLAMDPDAVLILSLALGAAVEGFYTLAKKRGWAT